MGRLGALGLVVLLVACQASNPTSSPAPSGSPAAINVRKASLPPLDPDSLDAGLGWAEIYDVELPEDAFRLDPSVAPYTPGGGRSGHPGHFPGQAVMADVVDTGQGLVAVGYVGDPWTAIAWTSQDGFAWHLETIESHDPSFAVAVGLGTDGTVVAVGRDGSDAAAWVRAADETWRRSAVETGGGEATRMTVVLSVPSGWIAGGSVGPELGDRRARFWTSADGQTWSPVADGPEFDGAEIVDLLTHGDELVALGRLGTGQRSTGSIAWVSGDGSNWARIEHAALSEGLVAALAPGPEGGVVAVGSDVDERAAEVWVSGDGRDWEHVPIEDSRLNHGNKIRMTDVVGTPGGLVAVGNEVPLQFGLGDSWLSTDGRSWTKSPRQATLGQSEPHAIVIGERYLVAVGDQGAPDNRVPTVWLSPIPGR